MTPIDRLLEHRVNKLVESCCLGRLDVPPVDLHQIARRRGVFAIEERRMIPEAVLSPEKTGFRIYLQSNFKDFPGARVRQRFSLAHEIAHTFFYDLRGGVQKPIKGAPRGDALEFACHKGASMLLVPEPVLNRELRHIGEPVGAECTMELARRFDVSTEVMMKRLSEIRAFEPTDTAVILVRRPSGGMAVIERAVYPPWLRSVLPAPERGTAFALWIQNPDRYFRSDASQHDDLLFETGLKRRVALGSLSVRPFRVTASQHIFELRLETGSSETQMPAES